MGTKMRIEAIGIEGARHTHTAEVSGLEGLSELPPPPTGTSLADALDLIVGALDASRVSAVAARLGLGSRVEVVPDGLATDTLAGLEPEGVRALVDDLPVRRLVAEATVALDPPLYRALRDQAVRDPRVLAALSMGASLTARVGWLFNRAGTHASLSVLALRVGEVRFALEASERPPWVPELLRDVAGRIGRLDPTRPADDVSAELLAASLAPDPALRRRFAQARTLTDAAPFHLGRLELVRRGDRVDPCFGDALVPARLLGPAADEAVRWVHAAVVWAPDVLVTPLPGGDPRLLAWLGDRMGEDATLEQVLWIGGPR